MPILPFLGGAGGGLFLLIRQISCQLCYCSLHKIGYGSANDASKETLHRRFLSAFLFFALFLLLSVCLFLLPFHSFLCFKGSLFVLFALFENLLSCRLPVNGSVVLATDARCLVYLASLFAGDGTNLTQREENLCFLYNRRCTLLVEE